MFNLTPAELGLPPKFSTWRPGQWECVRTGALTDKRFIAAPIATGGGKSVFDVGVALLAGGRGLYVTSSKGLQDQLVDDFTACGLVDMRGRQNYDCIRGGMSCAEGRLADCKDLACRYSTARSCFQESDLASTNYAYLLSSAMHSEGVGKVDTLILDEAHNAVQELSSAVQITLHHASYEQFYGSMGQAPPFGRSLSEWRTWAKFLQPKATTLLQEYKKQGSKAKWLSALDRFCGDLKRISEVPESWILDESEPGQTQICPLWPTDYAEQYLFCGAPRVVLSSATLVPKTLSLLGIQPQDTVFVTSDHTFPARRCPIYIMPAGMDRDGYGGIRIDYKTAEADWQSAMGVMDTFIRRRLDRKGMITAPSYDWNRRILASTEHAPYIIAPKNARELPAAIEQWMRSPAPSILMSPAITTGFDFKYQLCEYTIILKVPFIPTHKSPVMKARIAADKEYADYLTSQTLAQTPGRGMRASDDQNETLLLDAHAKWFFGKPEKGGKRHLFPSYFLRQLQYPISQPDPLPSLASQGIGNKAA